MKAWDEAGATLNPEVGLGG